MTAPSSRCLACGGPVLDAVEEVAARDLAAAWASCDHANGEATLAEARAERLMAALPPTVRFLRCRDCGLEMAEPRVPWESAAYPADQSYPVRWEFHQCVADLGPAPLDVLEIGCGTGEFLALAARAGHRVVGLDFSATAVAAARARGFDAICGSLDDLAGHVGADRRFDAGVFFHVIEHLEDPAAFLAGLEAWVRPGGRVFLSCPGPRRFTRMITEQRVGSSDFWDFPPHHVLRWTEGALTRFLLARGWTPTSAIEEPFLWRDAGSRLGVARALYRGRLSSGWWRRVYIAIGCLRALAAPRTRRAGDALYVSARMTGGAS